MTEVPVEESRSLTAHQPWEPLTDEKKWLLIHDLCSKHRGEVREINGSWRYRGTPFPTENTFFHAQYCWSLEEAKMRTHWVGKRQRQACN